MSNTGDKILRDSFKIHSYDSDFRGRATVSALCRFMQEMAWNHAERLGVGFSHLNEKGLLWVLSRKKIRFREFPKWGDTVSLATWPSGKSNLFSFRDFRLLNSRDEELAIASSAWIVIDKSNRRPQRTDSYIDDRLIFSDSAFEEYPSKIEPVNPGTDQFVSKVNYSDIDVNGHLNNIKYYDFVLNSFDQDFYKTNRLLKLDINFLSEVFFGEEINNGLENSGNSTYLHTISVRKTKKEICRAITSWVHEDKK